MNEKLKELVKLSTENPDLEIVCMVNSEVFKSDESTYWSCGISSVRIDDVYSDDESIYLDADDIIEQLRVELEDSPLDGDAFDSAVEERFNKLVELGEIVKKIIVYLNA